MARKTRVVIDDPARNDLELAAWNEWKEICSVRRCRENYRESLKNRLWKTAKKKLEYLLGSFESAWGTEYSEEGWKDEVAERFDGFIVEALKGGTEEKPRRKYYKDTIWKAIDENKAQGKADPPLKVIRGTLTAEHRVLDGVIEKLVKERGWTPNVVDHKVVVVVSGDELEPGPCDHDEGETVIEKTSSETVVNVTDEDRQAIASKIRAEFSFEECALLMAYMKHIALGNPIVKAVTGKATETNTKILYGRTDKKTGKVLRVGAIDRFKHIDEIYELALDVGWHDVFSIVNEALKSVIDTEKRGERFLSDIGLAE